MSERRAELEKKRLKLEQLRAQKQANKNNMRNSEFMQDLGIGGFHASSPNRASPASLTSSTDSSLPAASLRATDDIDSILQSVGISSDRGQRNHLDSVGPPHQNGGLPPNLLSPDSGAPSETKASPVSHHAAPAVVNFTIASFPQVLIAPKEHVTYEKQTQTTASTQSTSSNDRGGPLDYYVIHWDEEWDDEFQVLTYNDGDLDGEEGEESSGLFGSGGSFGPASGGNQAATQTPRDSHQPKTSSHHHPQHQIHRQQSQQHNQQQSLPHVEMVPPPHDDFALAAEKEKEEAKLREANRRHEYKEEERRHIMQTEAFRKFLDRAVRITERALSCTDSMDILVDYTGQVETVDSEDKSGLRLSLNSTFMDERWSKGRAVTCFDWCAQFPELLVASYNQNDGAPNEPDGICLVWNMKFKKTTPEYVFHCQSPVMSACFAKFHPNLILGGTYSGQIVLWDNRSGKRVPVQRSPLSASAHTHPVYCLKVVGSQNSHNLISVSNDGKLCSWSLDMLSAPQETMELCQQKQSRSIAAMSTSFPQSDYNNFVVGSQDGAVFSACRHGAKAGILDVFEGHQGPVTAVDFHAAPSTQYDFSHLFLTSSFDWTFKLWSLREQKCLYSFEDGSDYLYDVRWSPIHPALFATVDGLGRLDIWNLNVDTELPTVSTYVEPSMSALNRLIWSPNGQQLVVGDDGGRIAVYDVGEQLAFPKNDEWSRFAHTLADFTNNSIDI